MHVEILLRIYWTAHAVDPADSVEWSRADELRQLGLVELCGNGFATTERGDVYVKAILHLPLPQPTWVMPS
jgi:hypothetical protein